MSAVDVDSIRAAHIGKTIQLMGIVSEISENKIGISSSVYCCQYCGCSYTVQNEVPHGMPTKPRKCSDETGCGRANPGFEFDEAQSTFIDFSVIELRSTLGERYQDRFELVVTGMETDHIFIGSEVICEAQIRSNEAKGHMIIPYGLSDNVNVTEHSAMIHDFQAGMSLSARAVGQKVIRDICGERGNAHVTEIYNKAASRNVPDTTVDEILAKMLLTGELFSPRNDEYSFAR
jgi:DNA replicative helicase MCM subunit Mcm2 (Cdc46/Mcm family)